MMHTKFQFNGTRVSVIRVSDETSLDRLPPKVYSVQFNEFTGFYLSVVKDRLQLPEKIYGIAPERVNKCITTYLDRDTSTGILLTGDKGTGKTLLMSLLANTVMDELDLPVLLVRDAYTGEQFDQFIQAIGECCVVFDEFGKLYSSTNREKGPKQDSLLGLLDGVDKTKRLIIMTENSELDISDFMLNRPSRMYYHFRYKKLDEGSIKGYCDDHDVSVRTTRDIIDLSRRSRIFSFDMLQSIVEEHLRFDSPIDEVVEELNIDIRQQMGAELEIVKVVDRSNDQERQLAQGAKVSMPKGSYDYTYIKLVPTDEESEAAGQLARDVAAIAGVDIDEDDHNIEEFHIAAKDLAYESAGRLVYETEKFLVVAKEVPAQSANYSLLF